MFLKKVSAAFLTQAFVVGKSCFQAYVEYNYFILFLDIFKKRVFECYVCNFSRDLMNLFDGLPY
jgi:hypothetical protein